MAQMDAEVTKKTAKHRVHIEQAIGKIKKFKILSATNWTYTHSMQETSTIRRSKTDLAEDFTGYD